MTAKFWICVSGDHVYLRKKINQAISKVHGDLKAGHRRSYSIRVNESNRALMCFRCGCPGNWLRITGWYELIVKPDHIDTTHKPRRVEKC